MKQEPPLIDIRPDHWEIVRAILQKHVPQFTVWAFGSRAKWKAKEYSDLDLAIITEQPLSLDISASLSDDFSESDLPWKVDVVDWATTSESFRKIIERDKVVVLEGQPNLDMGIKWSETYVGDLLSFRNGRSSPKRADGLPFPVYGSNGIIGYTKDINADSGVIIIGRVGSYCGSLYRSVKKCWVTDNAIRAVAKDCHDSRFLFYLLGTLALNTRQTGSGQPLLNQDILSRIPVTVPQATEQRAIGHILGTLDDKIELLRKQNETLEEMARAMFKAWFVDFEPVRAKMDGRWQRGQSLPGLPADLYDLFPDRLVDSELGEIPEGWIKQPVKDIGPIICGKTPSTKMLEYYGEDVPFITIPEMHDRIFAIDIKRRLSHKGANTQVKKMLPAGAICVSCIATLGLVIITTEPSQTNQQINSVIPAQDDETYYWYWTIRNLGEEIKAGGSGGSVLSNLSTGRFSELQVSASTHKLRLAYNSSVEGLFTQIQVNQNESQTLSLLRNTMLPKLIAGELRIADPKRFTEKAGV